MTSLKHTLKPTLKQRNDGTLDRRAVTQVLLRDPGGLLVVTGLGAASYDVGVLGDREQNFYLWGAMGGTAMIGLGLALAQPARRVLKRIYSADAGPDLAPGVHFHQCIVNGDGVVRVRLDIVAPKDSDERCIF